MNKKALLVLLFITHSILLIASDGLSVSGIKKLNEKIKEYKYVGHFHEDLAIVVKDGKIGFINKSGDLVIPMKWDATNLRTSWPDYYEDYEEEVMFNNGLCCIPSTKSSNIYLIDKNGNELYSGKKPNIIKTRDFDVLYLDNKSGHSTYFLKKDTVEKMEAYENDHVVIARNWNYNAPGRFTEIYFSLEKLCDGKIVGKKTLEKKYGYRVSSENYSSDGMGLITLYNIKTKKYGIVDEKGNVVVPFQYDNNIMLCYGLLIEGITVNYDSKDLESQKLLVCCNVYKDGRLLYEHLPPCTLYDSMGMLLFEEYEESKSVISLKYMCNLDDSKIPEINNVTKCIDLNGREVSRFQFGNNYLRPVFDDNNRYRGWWQLEDEEGQLVYPNQFKIDYRFQNIVEIENRNTHEVKYLTDMGDTIFIQSQYYHYLEAGIIKMTNFPKNVVLLCNYKKELSDKDNYRNCHYFRKYDKSKVNAVRFDGLKLLPFDVDEVGYFSEGLLRVKLGNRYFFIDEKGNGLIED